MPFDYLHPISPIYFPVIEIDQIDKRFGKTRALRGVSASIAPGQIVALVGPNGAGKTTLLRILVGVLRPDAGSVKLADIDVTSERERVASRIGYLPEGPPLYGDMRVDEMLRFRARLKGLERAERAERIDRVLERVRLTDKRRRLIGQLSRGQRQRVGLADALLSDPEVLVLDEPTAGLDPEQVGELRTTLTDIGSDRAILLSSHALAELDRLASRWLVLFDGRMVADGEPDALREQAGVSAAAPSVDVYMALIEKAKAAAKASAASEREVP